jgi:hypothetical protein
MTLHMSINKEVIPFIISQVEKGPTPQRKHLRKHTVKAIDHSSASSSPTSKTSRLIINDIAINH